MAKGLAQFNPMTLRQKIVALSGGLILLSAAGFALSLYQISGVRDLHDHLNRVMVPMGRVLTQLRGDTDLYRRELDRNLGMNHWGDSRWNARPVPNWLDEVLDFELSEIQKFLGMHSEWANPAGRVLFQEWLQQTLNYRSSLRSTSQELINLLKESKTQEAAMLYPQYTKNLENFQKQIQWGLDEYDRLFRSTFEETERRVGDFKAGFEVVVLVVLSLSLLLLGYGQRALRPLKAMTELAREIAARGFKKEDKDFLLKIPSANAPELQELTHEFHRMATSLMEREKMIESQKSRLEQQNQQLRQMGELQNRLRHAEHLAAIGRLSAQVAHEVRNPLHSIGLEAEMALELVNRTESSDLRQSLQSILNGVDRLDKITENYLKLSKLSSGKKVVFDLAGVLEAVLATYSALFQSHQIMVDWNYDEGQGFLVFGDPDLIEQAIGNLVRNAVQALESLSDNVSDKKIVFQLKREESGVELRIYDSGPGISAEIRDRLFTPFATTKAQGTGLGLSFVKQVIEEHQGHVAAIETENPGACFVIDLPYSKPSREVTL